jgi:hypothetical protein
MKVFISWSGEPSRQVAEALRQWIPDVIQSVTPWMSQADIAPGARWNREIQKELSDTRFGVICLTHPNQQAPWILFEAGALAKSIEETFVCPYLIGMEPSELLPGPLTQFQAKRANEEGTWELILGMNRALAENALEESRLRRLFERSWPDLNAVLESVGEFSEPTEPRRSAENMVAEILETVRGLARNDTAALVPNPLPEPWSEEATRAFLEYSREYVNFLRTQLAHRESERKVEPERRPIYR